MPISSVDLARVRALPLFAGMSEEQFRGLMAEAAAEQVPAGAVLLTEGDPVEVLHVLLDGAVELQGAWNDKTSTLAVIRPVSTFILAAVINEANGLMSAYALERSSILTIPGEVLREAMRRDAAFCFAVAQELAGCYRGVVRALKNQKLRGGLERLANYLISQQTRQGGAETFTLPQEKRVLASLLGMTPENLSRAFASLGDYGVTVSGPVVTIGKPGLLRRLAKPDPLIELMDPAPAADADHWLSGEGRFADAG